MTTTSHQGSCHCGRVNCLDGIELRDLSIQYWDGRHDNWEAGPRSTPWPILA